MKQLFYTIGEPPGILLRLLPAPQLAIMSLDYGGVMKGLYGEDCLKGETWVEVMESESNRTGKNGETEESDQYDDESEYDYDGED